MKKINLITSTSTKNSFIKDGVYFYLNRLSNFIKTELIQKKKYNQSKIIKTYFASRNYNIGLSVEGNEYTTERFSKKINNLLINYDCINFFVGSPSGLENIITEKVNMFISISKLTFTSELSLLIFSEQLYRAFTIINNHPYHKK